MKLQLSPTQVGDFVLKVGAKTVKADPLEALREDVAAVLAAFRQGGHDPLTRKDVAAVLVGLGYDSAWVEKDSAAYQAITNVLSARCSPTLDAGGPLRGFYSQNKAGGATASKSPPPAPVPSAAALPEPTADEEIHINVIPVAGLSLADIGIGFASFVQSKAVMAAASLYEQDLGLRRLAVAASPCYGTGFEETESACRECPLAARCAKQSVAFLGSVAADLDQATERSINTAVETERRRLAEQKAREAERKRLEAAAKATNIPPTGMGPTPVAPAPASPAPVIIPSGGMMTVAHAQQALAAAYPGKGLSAISIPFEGVCSKCGERITKNALGVHLDATVVKSGKPGMWHLECALSGNPDATVKSGKPSGWKLEA